MLANTTKLVGFAYLLPALLFTCVFVVYPLGHLVMLSLTNESLLGGGEFVGLDNYRDAFADRSFWKARRSRNFGSFPPNRRKRVLRIDGGSCAS